MKLGPDCQILFQAPGLGRWSSFCLLLVNWQQQTMNNLRLSEKHLRTSFKMYVFFFFWGGDVSSLRPCLRAPSKPWIGSWRWTAGRAVPWNCWTGCKQMMRWSSPCGLDQQFWFGLVVMNFGWIFDHSSFFFFGRLCFFERPFWCSICFSSHFSRNW